MRIFFYLCFLIVLTSQLPAAELNTFFENRTMRIDYYHCGDKNTDEIVSDLIYKAGEWAGNPHSLMDPFNNGKYYYKVYDLNSNKLIYSKGFNNFFHEYQTTKPASEGIKRIFHETALIPYPKNKIIFVIEKRNEYNILSPIYTQIIDPADYHIISASSASDDLIIKEKISGSPHQCVDIVMIGEGYTDKEKKKFRQDVQRYTLELFSIEPFKSNQSKFNLRGVLRPSRESGVDEPTKKIYKNTILNASFNTFDSQRYLLTENNKILQDIAGQVPFDAIIILANIDRYGGGGIYNFYSISTANESTWNDYVFLHEFGHSFAGLADEYYSSSVAYDEFYPEGVEPTEPNITRLIDQSNVKWKQLLSPGLEVPTDWGKAKFDSMVVRTTELYEEQRDTVKILALEGKTADEIDQIKLQYKIAVKENHENLKKFSENHPLRGKVGVFEGAGYNSHGMYRPTLNSIMHQFNNQDKDFYPVNVKAIQEVIDYYTKQY